MASRKIKKVDEGAQLAAVLKEAFAKTASTSLPVAKGKPALTLSDKRELSIKEASALTGYTSQLVIEAIHDGVLKATKQSGRWILKRADLDDWIRRL